MFELRWSSTQIPFFLKIGQTQFFFLSQDTYELRDNKTNVFMPTVTMVTKILTPNCDFRGLALKRISHELINRKMNERC